MSGIPTLERLFYSCQVLVSPLYFYVMSTLLALIVFGVFVYWLATWRHYRRRYIDHRSLWVRILARIGSWGILAGLGLLVLYLG